MSKESKCVACGWELSDTVIRVKVGTNVVEVCCEECADKVRAGLTSTPART
jgi:hypothetical protein